MPIAKKLWCAARQGAFIGVVLMTIAMAVHLRHIPFQAILLILLMFAVPMGAWFGIAFGCAQVLISREERELAGQICVGAGLSVLAFVLIFGVWTHFYLAYVLFVMPCITAACSCLYGWWLQSQ